MIETLVAPNPGAFTLDGTHTYVIDGVAVIDPGPAIDSHIEAIVAKLTVEPAIFVTHRHGDHAPGATLLRERCGGRIYAAPGAASSIDHLLADGEELAFERFSIRAVATPGHTAEHLCFLMANGELFTGDTVLGEGTTVIFPPDGNMNDYISSLEKLIALQPRVIYPGHGPARHDAVALLNGYLNHRLMREDQIRNKLREGRKSIPELRASIYPGLDPRLVQAAELQIQAHLERLTSHHEVAEHDERFWLAGPGS